MTEPPDRATILAAVMPALLGASIDPDRDPDAVGHGRIVADRPGVVAGVVVAREAFGRLGARCRALVDEGDRIDAGTSVAEVGGPIAAIRGAAPVALMWLQRLSAVATGAAPPEPGDPLDAYAARLSRPDVVGEAEPSPPIFHLEL